MYAAGIVGFHHPSDLPVKVGDNIIVPRGTVAFDLGNPFNWSVYRRNIRVHVERVDPGNSVHIDDIPEFERDHFGRWGHLFRIRDLCNELCVNSEIDEHEWANIRRSLFIHTRNPQIIWRGRENIRSADINCVLGCSPNALHIPFLKEKLLALLPKRFHTALDCIQ